MSASQKYSLRWNDFSVNVATTFRDLHSRQDFVDVTLACADGSTLDAHKVILSSVSSYFRDILKNAPCKHPIIILKDTCREEASAMLEFAYTGEVNVGQELLPSLLHTAKCFKIKGLDNVQTPPGLLDLNTSHSNDSDNWGGGGSSRPPTRPPTPATRPHTPHTRSHTPSTRPPSPATAATTPVNVGAGSLGSHPHSPNSVQSSNTIPQPLTQDPQQPGALPDQTLHLQQQQQQHLQQQQDVKPPPFLIDQNSDLKPFADHFLVGGPGLARAPSSSGGSQPPTRPTSPMLHNSNSNGGTSSNARTPPPKRWKRSFDMARGGEEAAAAAAAAAVAASTACVEENGHHPQLQQQPGPIMNGGNGPLNDYGEPMAKRFCDVTPTAATKRFSTDSERRFAEADSNGSRRFVEPRPMASYPHSTPASPTMMDTRNLGSSLGLLRHLARLEEPREAHENSRIEHPNSRSEESVEQDPLDYRFQAADQSEGDIEKEKARHERLAFRPESAPTVLDMSPEASRLSIDGILKHEQDDRFSQLRNMVGTMQPGSSVNDSISDCLNKSLGSVGGSGRYTCDECGKLFRHPGSLQHHRHIHRGTHRCPSCGKAFSRRWDMERHLNKSKYGCPANRFGSPGSAGPASPVSQPNQHSLLAIIPHSTQLNTN